jgi:uncharacterized peroxidase-related enzyme
VETLKPLKVDAAPLGSKAMLQAIQNRLGFIPNLIATLAHSPMLLGSYVGLDAVWQKSSFTSTERQLILLVAFIENHCRYCVAAHATSLKGLKFSSRCIQAVKERAPLDDPRLDALVAATRELVSERGFITPKTRERFLQAGFSETAPIELLVGIALKVISNYLDHLNPVAIDAAFRGEA